MGGSPEVGPCESGGADAGRRFLQYGCRRADLREREILSNLKGGQWEQNGIRDVKVMAYGNTAIATGTWEGKGIDGDGTKIDRAERWTDTWVKMPGGKWQCVASQQTSTPKR